MIASQRNESVVSFSVLRSSGLVAVVVSVENFGHARRGVCVGRHAKYLGVRLGYSLPFYSSRYVVYVHYLLLLYHWAWGSRCHRGKI